MSGRRHLDSPMVAELLERCACLWQTNVAQVGELTCYATARGLVVFLDMRDRDDPAKWVGWTVLTEVPSNTHAGCAAVLAECMKQAPKHDRGRAVRVLLDALDQARPVSGLMLIEAEADLDDLVTPRLDPGIVKAAEELGKARAMVVDVLESLDDVAGLDDLIPPTSDARRALEILRKHFEIEVSL